MSDQNTAIGIMIPGRAGIVAVAGVVSATKKANKKAGEELVSILDDNR